MPYDAPSDLDGLSLEQIAALVAQRRLPPVESWNPEPCGDSDMRITADGRWYHQGGEIKRPAMVRAFSSLLRRDADGQHWLVTPQELLTIEVEDVPFVAVEMTSEGEGEERNLAFRLNSDDLVIADEEHALAAEDRGFGPLVYLHVRGGLWARLARPVFYELAEYALEGDMLAPHIWSKGERFDLGALL